MVKKENRPVYICEHNGCGREFGDLEKAAACEARGIEGPEIEKGWIFGSCKKNYNIMDEKQKPEYMTQVDVYISTGENGSEGHDKIYSFVRVDFPPKNGGILGGTIERPAFEEVDLTKRKVEWAMETSRDSYFGHLEDKDYKRAVEIIESEDELEELRDFLKEKGVEEFYQDIKFASKFRRQKWKDYHE